MEFRILVRSREMVARVLGFESTNAKRMISMSNSTGRLRRGDEYDDTSDSEKERSLACCRRVVVVIVDMMVVGGKVLILLGFTRFS